MNRNTISAEEKEMHEVKTRLEAVANLKYKILIRRHKISENNSKFWNLNSDSNTCMHTYSLLGARQLQVHKRLQEKFDVGWQIEKCRLCIIWFQWWEKKFHHQLFWQMEILESNEMLNQIDFMAWILCTMISLCGNKFWIVETTYKCIIVD